MFLIPLFVVSIFLALPAIWLCAIRPYCVKHGKGFTPGANIGVTIWIDWQEARELAKECADGRMIFWCRAFLAIQVFWAVVFTLGLIAAVLGG
jgi:hypothetical protein